MQTRIIQGEDRKGIREAAQMLREGKLVAFPTETVYGLGADALNAQAVREIYLAKGRPSDNPLIVHIWDRKQLNALCLYVPEKAQALMDAYWPGPMTLVMPKKEIVPDATTGGLGTVAVRMPDHPVAHALLKEADVPVAAPSANLSGKPSPTDAAAVIEDLQGRVPAIIDGGPCRVGVESTVIDVTGEIPVILRPGGVTREMIERIVGETKVHRAVLNPLESKEQAASPGMKYKHYAPKAKVRVIIGKQAAQRICACYDEAVREGKNPVIYSVEEERAAFGGRAFYPWGVMGEEETIAQHLFASLRHADEEGMDLVLCHGTDTHGMGLAVMNRLLRAAGFDIEAAD